VVDPFTMVARPEASIVGGHSSHRSHRSNNAIESNIQVGRSEWRSCSAREVSLWIGPSVVSEHLSSTSECYLSRHFGFIPENLMTKANGTPRFTCVRHRNQERSAGPMSGDKLHLGTRPISLWIDFGLARHAFKEVLCATRSKRS
jgi:hypothetical protein